jgi:hypothetical protein
MARMKEMSRIEMWWGGVKWSVWRMARMMAIEWALVLPLAASLLPLVPHNLKASETMPGISLEKS